ncbi:hypothetical protein [Haloechinothrix halophila]|uniref:hypothetical protein n=1 Tax=Haloechinothrix halophila TaxID=1069073 RepID=UPI0005567332|nr:hypothetical protein [Haloechinothrix halophila]
MSRRVVFLHVGAPKTGTTYLQRIFFANRGLLASRGVFVPGSRPLHHFRAGYDLRGVQQEPGHPAPSWDGAWDAMVEKIRKSGRKIAVVSDERLAACTVEEVERAVSSFEFADVHVIYATREPAGLLSAEWQEHVKHGDRRTFDRWLADTLGSRGKGWYWQVHGVGDVLRRWGSAVPSSQMHVMTLPQRDADPDLLWHRFCSVLGISPDDVDTDVQSNVSLGVEGAEVLRRANELMPVDFPEWHRIGVTREILAHSILAPRGEKTSIRVPEQWGEEVERYAEQLISDIKDCGCEIVGDLNELRGVNTQRDDAFTSSDLVPAAVDGIAGLMLHISELHDDLRKTRGELAEERKRRQTKERMAARAWASLREHRNLPPRERVKRCVVELGEQSRVVGRMLDVYRKLHPHKD